MKRIAALLASLLPLSLISAQNPTSPHPDMAAQRAEATLFFQRSLEINDLASKPQSLEDSHHLIDLIAAIFAKDIPPSRLTRSLRDQIAQAEYETANSTPTLIPEQRVADAWNRYIYTIGASPDALVTVAEIHNLRDGSYAAARYMWSRGSRSIWSTPAIYATTPDQKLADGCTAVEVLRILSDITNQFGNLRGARERVKAGVLVSDSLKPLPPGATPPRASVSFKVGRRDDPVGEAANRYASDHGTRALIHALQTLTNDLFRGQT
ncbi:hypothetical protein HDF16_002052 [Granulicella aggregans]|uniref:LPP20 lipoprotein n=1 Tax=Granulicella aggregans TaxID=474949 RepID=A0A7W7ZCM6_9BACT|nr:hypothetical protein [Granulicella aggregans]MBB5057367.1 hypothetical protein [Granulicella aggregans]